MDKCNVQDSRYGFGSTSHGLPEYENTVDAPLIPSPIYLSAAYEKYGNNVAMRGKLPGVTFHPDTGIVTCMHTGLITNTRTGKVTMLDGTLISEAKLHESSYIPTTKEQKKERLRKKAAKRETATAAHNYMTLSSSSDDDEYGPMSKNFIKGRRALAEADIVEYKRGNTKGIQAAMVCAASLAPIPFPTTLMQRRALAKKQADDDAAVVDGGGGATANAILTVDDMYAARTSNFNQTLNELLATSSSSDPDEDIENRDASRINRLRAITSRFDDRNTEIMEEFNKTFD